MRAGTTRSRLECEDSGLDNPFFYYMLLFHYLSCDLVFFTCRFFNLCYDCPRAFPINRKDAGRIEDRRQEAAEVVI